MEGMQAFMRRHAPSLPRADTFFLAVDTIGSPHLTAIRGEGMLYMNEIRARASRWSTPSPRSSASICSRICACAMRRTGCMPSSGATSAPASGP